ncbi:stromal cell-derived factor 1-like [Scleropages formosus]|uniref:Stromal cell-derived factor 1-like n=1 Tax=Scleropages formosus TaxID=113540 RepID=A0A0P7V4V4_SCLFO|nr:stromal cell-derived factor 1-like [Scleropages formosus]
MKAKRREPIAMDPRLFALSALLALAVYAHVSAAKPISLVERCWCRSTVNSVSPRSIRELKFVQTANCPIQVMYVIHVLFKCPLLTRLPQACPLFPAAGIAKLKSSKEVCINPDLKWLQQYVRNVVNKAKKTK